MAENRNRDRIAPAIVTGCEDKFHYEIADTCILCGACAASGWSICLYDC